MMATEFCRLCHQPRSDAVAGRRLTIFKAELFHFIESHPGQSGSDIAQHFSKNTNVIKVHIFQINDRLMDTGVRIRGAKFTGYYVEKPRAAE